MASRPTPGWRRSSRYPAAEGRCDSGPCWPAAQGDLEVVSAEVQGQYPAITPECPQAHWFEREIFEQCGVRPVGHPWLKPLAFPRPADMWHDRLLRDGGRRGPRGGRRPGPRRHHRAGPFPLPMPRRDRLSPGDLPGLSASRRGTGDARRPRSTHDPLHGDARRRQHRRARDGLLPRRRGAQRYPRSRPRPGASRRGPGIGAGGQPYWATWAHWPATWVSCPRCPIAGGSAATCST